MELAGADWGVPPRVKKFKPHLWRSGMFSLNLNKGLHFQGETLTYLENLDSRAEDQRLGIDVNGRSGIGEDVRGDL